MREILFIRSIHLCKIRHVCQKHRRLFKFPTLLIYSIFRFGFFSYLDDLVKPAAGFCQYRLGTLAASGGFVGYAAFDELAGFCSGDLARYEYHGRRFYCLGLRRIYISKRRRGRERKGGGRCT